MPVLLYTVPRRILRVKCCTWSFFINLSGVFLMLFFFKAKAKEKKEQKAGERDDTIPPEYRLTPELVSFSNVHCFVGRVLCLALSFITERERSQGKQTKLVFNQWLFSLVISITLIASSFFVSITVFSRHSGQRSNLIHEMGESSQMAKSPILSPRVTVSAL